MQLVPTLTGRGPCGQRWIGSESVHWARPQIVVLLFYNYKLGQATEACTGRFSTRTRPWTHDAIERERNRLTDLRNHKIHRRCARAASSIPSFPNLPANPKNFRPSSISFFPLPPHILLPNSHEELESNPIQPATTPSYSPGVLGPPDSADPDPSSTATAVPDSFTDQMGRPRKTKAEPEPVPAFSIGVLDLRPRSIVFNSLFRSPQKPILVLFGQATARWRSAGADCGARRRSRG